MATASSSRAQYHQNHLFRFIVTSTVLAALVFLCAGHIASVQSTSNQSTTLENITILPLISVFQTKLNLLNTRNNATTTIINSPTTNNNKNATNSSNINHDAYNKTKTNDLFVGKQLIAGVNKAVKEIGGLINGNDDSSAYMLGVAVSSLLGTSALGGGCCCCCSKLCFKYCCKGCCMACSKCCSYYKKNKASKDETTDKKSKHTPEHEMPENTNCCTACYSCCYRCCCCCCEDDKHHYEHDQSHHQHYHHHNRHYRHFPNHGFQGKPHPATSTEKEAELGGKAKTPLTVVNQIPTIQLDSEFACHCDPK